MRFLFLFGIEAYGQTLIKNWEDIKHSITLSTKILAQSLNIALELYTSDTTTLVTTSTATTSSLITLQSMKIDNTTYEMIEEKVTSLDQIKMIANGDIKYLNTLIQSIVKTHDNSRNTKRKKRKSNDTSQNNSDNDNEEESKTDTNNLITHTPPKRKTQTPERFTFPKQIRKKQKTRRPNKPQSSTETDESTDTWEDRETTINNEAMTEEMDDYETVIGIREALSKSIEEQQEERKHLAEFHENIHIYTKQATLHISKFYELCDTFKKPFIGTPSLLYYTSKEGLQIPFYYH
jgi:hypothetical protein